MASEYDEAIRRCIDAQLEIERKAAAWDALRENFRQADRQSLVDLMDSLAHPARACSNC